MPKAYWIARLDITDEASYAEYRKLNGIAFAKYVADPWCGFPADFPYDEMAYLAAPPTDAIPRGLPILVLNGSVDPVGGEAGGRALVDAYRALGVADVSFLCYPDGRHEMFNEINRDQVTADLLSWLAAH